MHEVFYTRRNATNSKLTFPKKSKLLLKFTEAALMNYFSFI